MPAFRAAGCEVVAIAASTRERAQTVASRFGIPRASGRWQDVVDEGCDALAIAVPPELQPEVVTYAAAAGKHVFCEKPIAADLTLAKAMLDAVQRAGVVHAVDFEFPELASWKHARAACAEIAPLRHAYIDWRVSTHSERPGTHWKRRTAAGGSVLGGFAAHALYHVEWLVGRVTSLHARLAPAPDEPTRADIMLRTIDATVTITLASDAIGGSGHRLEIYGDRGSVRLDDHGAPVGSEFRLAIAERGGTRVMEAPAMAQGDPRLAPVLEIVRRFVAAIPARGRVRPDLDDGLRVQKLLDAVRRSDATDASVSI